MNCFEKQDERKGFTLVELLVVIAIIGVLIGLLLPAVQAAREAARRMQCSNKIKQLSLAAHNYHDTNGSFPCDGTTDEKGSTTKIGGYKIGVFPRLLPFMEQSALYEKVSYDTTKNGTAGSDENLTLFEMACTRLDALHCPSSDEATRMSTSTPNTSFESGPGLTFTMHYYGLAGAHGLIPGTTTKYLGQNSDQNGYAALNGVMYPGAFSTMGSIVDGTSNTFLFGEISWDHQGKGQHYRAWIRGVVQNATSENIVARKFQLMSSKNVALTKNGTGDLSSNRVGFNFRNRQPTGYASPYTYHATGYWGSDHPGGAHFGLGDGSVRFVSEAVNGDILLSYASMDYGESLPSLP